MAAKKSWKRSILDAINYLANPLELRIISSTEYSKLECSAMKASLASESKLTALAGTISAFSSYLLEKNIQCVQMEALRNNAQFLIDPTPLANTVSEISQNAEEPIDAFMHYYAKYFTESNSQWSQDIFVSYACKRKTSGRFFEVGGADGITHSNTFSLENHFGWTGLIAEPHPAQYSILTTTRKLHRNIILNCAATPHEAQDKVELTDAWQLSSIEADSTSDLHSATRRTAVTKFSVDAVPMQKLLDSCDTVDYLSLDVEGPEYDLLASVDWKTTPLPSVITVEHNWRPETMAKLRSLLTGLGYHEHFDDKPWLTRGDLWFTTHPLPHT